MTLRDKRLENEWKFLLQLQQDNPDLIRDASRTSLHGGDWLEFILRETSAFTLPDGANRLATHRVKLHFPEYFPAVPIEAYLDVPVLHPNVHPENGFVCLWDRFSPGDSVIESVRQLQRVLSWELFNPHADHLMQVAALQDIPADIPLPYRAVQLSPSLSEAHAYAAPPLNRRQRLS